MKKSYSFLLFLSLLLFSTFCLGQDCVTQKAVSDDTICFGQNASIVLSGSETGVNYQLRIGATNIGTPLAGNGGDLTFTVSPSSTTNYTIYVVECDITYTDEGIVTVNPTPVASASTPNQTRCSGIALGSFGVTSNVAGTTYNWTRDNTVNTTGIAASGSGAIIGTLTNTTNSPQIVNFTITPTANGCNGIPITVSATINPTPNVVATPNTQNVCSGLPISDIIYPSVLLQVQPSIGQETTL